MADKLTEVRMDSFVGNPCAISAIYDDCASSSNSQLNEMAKLLSKISAPAKKIERLSRQNRDIVCFNEILNLLFAAKKTT